MLKVWGRPNCPKCLDCEALLTKAGFKFERADITKILVGTWLSDPKSDQVLCREVAAAYVLNHGMPVVQVGKRCVSCFGALKLLQEGDLEEKKLD